MSRREEEKGEKDWYSPTRMRINAGSSATFVRRDRLLKVSFSVHAQTPTAMMPRPSHCDKERERMEVRVRDWLK